MRSDKRVLREGKQGDRGRGGDVLPGERVLPWGERRGEQWDGGVLCRWWRRGGDVLRSIRFGEQVLLRRWRRLLGEESENVAQGGWSRRSSLWSGIEEEDGRNLDRVKVNVTYHMLEKKIGFFFLLWLTLPLKKSCNEFPSWSTELSILSNLAFTKEVSIAFKSTCCWPRWGNAWRISTFWSVSPSSKFAKTLAAKTPYSGIENKECANKEWSGNLLRK